MKIKVDYVTNSSSEIFGVVMRDGVLVAGLTGWLVTVLNGYGATSVPGTWDEVSSGSLGEETGMDGLSEAGSMPDLPGITGITDILDLINEGLMDQLDEPQAQLVDDFFDSLLETTDQASVVLEDLIQISGEAYHSWMDYLEYLGHGSDAVTEVMTNPFMALIGNRADDFLNASIVTELLNTYDGIVPEWFEDGAEATANEAWDVMGNTIGLLDELKYTDVGNSDLGSFMSLAGIIKDAIEHVGEGDSLLHGGIKSTLANTLQAYAWEKNPAVNVMDLFNYFAFDGSPAGDVISPSSTLQGSTNLLLDTINDLINGTDVTHERIRDGKYGGVIQIADDTMNLVFDMAYTSESILDDISNVVTDDQFYDDMYSTNEAFWRPKEDAWVVKRSACYVGEKVTEGFIKIADGTAQFSRWLGELSTHIW